MFAPRKGKASINPGGSPQFQALYIGNVDAFHALGQGCTRPLVQRMLDSCPAERYLPRVLLTLSVSELILKDLEKPKSSVAKFDIQNISYCSAENGEHERVFAWICKSNTDQTRPEHKLQCHAVLCSSKQKAQTISLVLSRAFQIAYRDWKTEKEKQERIKTAYHRGLQLEQSSARENQYKASNGQLVTSFTSTTTGQSEAGTTNIGNSHTENMASGSSQEGPENSSNSSDHVYEFDLEHKEMIESLKSFPKPADEDSVTCLNSQALGEMNIIEEGEIALTENSVAYDDGSQKL